MLDSERVCMTDNAMTAIPEAMCPEQPTGLTLNEPKAVAAALPAVVSSMKHVWGTAGVIRGTRALAMLNQKGGIDCTSCAWPDPDDHRAFAEFCENGAKAVADEATTKRVDREFFARHTIAELAAQSDHWLNAQGRLAEPMVLRVDLPVVAAVKQPGRAGRVPVAAVPSRPAFRAWMQAQNPTR